MQELKRILELKRYVFNPTIEERFEHLGLSEEYAVLKRYGAVEQGLVGLLEYLEPRNSTVKLDRAGQRLQAAIAGRAKSTYTGREVLGLAREADSVVDELLQAVTQALAFYWRDTERVGFIDERIENARPFLDYVYYALVTFRQDPIFREWYPRRAGRPRAEFKRQPICRAVTRLLNRACPTTPRFDDATQRRRALGSLTERIWKIVFVQEKSLSKGSPSIS